MRAYYRRQAFRGSFAGKLFHRFESPAQAAVYAFCRELIEKERVSDRLFGEAVDVLGQTGVVELVLRVGYYTTISMTLNVFDVPVPAGEKNRFPKL